jgi:hypothetical protein
MVKFIKFMQIQMQREGQSVSVRKMEVEINPERVGLITAAGIPSEMSGPDGTPILTDGTLMLVGNHEVLVEGKVDVIREHLEKATAKDYTVMDTTRTGE